MDENREAKKSHLAEATEGHRGQAENARGLSISEAALFAVYILYHSYSTDGLFAPLSLLWEAPAVTGSWCC